MTLLLFLTSAEFSANFHFLSSTTGGWGELQVGGSAPADATIGTGWRTEGLSAGQYARMEFGVVRAASAFGGTAQPSSGPDNTLKDCWRTANPLTGTIAAGPWTIQLPLIAPDANKEGAGLQAVMRLWRSVNSDGSGATEITSGAVTGSSVTALQSEASQISILTTTLGSVTFTGEYFFVQVAAKTV